MNHKNYKHILIILKYLISKNEFKITYYLVYYLLEDIHFFKELVLVLAILFK